MAWRAGTTACGGSADRPLRLTIPSMAGSAQSISCRWSKPKPSIERVIAARLPGLRIFSRQMWTEWMRLSADHRSRADRAGVISEDGNRALEAQIFCQIFFFNGRRTFNQATGRALTITHD